MNSQKLFKKCLFIGCASVLGLTACRNEANTPGAVFKWSYGAGPTEVRGSVVDQSEMPLPGVQVEVESTSGTTSSITDTKGGFAIVTGEATILNIRVDSHVLERKLDCSSGLTFHIQIK